MLLRAAAAALLVVCSSPAFADVSAEHEQALAELRAAAERAAAIGGQRWAFTLDYTDHARPEQKSFRLRFDPRLPEGERWRLIEPAESSLSKDERKALKRMSANDDADDILVYDRLADVVDDARVLTADAGSATFRLKTLDPDMSEEMRDAIAATATLDRRTGAVTAIELTSTRSFKPAAVARVDALKQEQRYQPAGPGGEVLMVAAKSEASGRAMMKPFAQKNESAYSDFEKVDAPPRRRPEKNER